MGIARKLFVTYFIACLLFMACAWQADILNANLVYPVKDELFEYWFHSWTKWTHYAWTFWGMALAFFLPLIVLVLHGLPKLLEKLRRGET